LSTHCCHATADVYRRYPQAAARRQQLLAASALGQHILRYEEQHSGTPAG
jgi:hypothetical protein